ncbi:MAG: DUF6151 family protein [Pseudomonadota bacterium]
MKTAASRYAGQRIETKWPEMMGESDQSGLAFSCICGEVTGRIKPQGLKHGSHAVCFCADCRAGQLYFKQPDPAPGPVEVFQIAPHELIFETGSENLAAIKLSPNGMLRWYAACCNAPLAATPNTPKFPFVGFIAARLSDTTALGPITTRAYIPTSGGKHKHAGIRAAIVAMLKRVAKSRLSGKWKQTPFFDVATGEPVVSPKLIDKSERDALYP